MTEAHGCDALPRADRVPHRPTWGPPPSGTAPHRTAVHRNAPRTARPALREGRPRSGSGRCPAGRPAPGAAPGGRAGGRHDNGVMDLPSLSSGDHLEARCKTCWSPRSFRAAARVSGSNSASTERKTRGRDETVSPQRCRGAHTPRLLRIPFCPVSRLLILASVAGGGGAQPWGRQRGYPPRQQGPQWCRVCWRLRKGEWNASRPEGGEPQQSTGHLHHGTAMLFVTSEWSFSPKI